MEKEYGQVSEKIYKVLTNKKFRARALPSEDIKKLILEKIEKKVSEKLPIKLLQAWGGCKNPNLPLDYAELCEEATLDNLKRLNEEVVEIYKPGLKIYICPGDGRVQNVNNIPENRTEKYIKTLTDIADKYNGLFSVIPVSVLYKKYSADFIGYLKKAEQDFAGDIHSRPDFEKMVCNAGKNVFHEDSESEKEIAERNEEAAKNYMVYRAAEENAEIFREFDDCIRSFFIKYAPFYKKYIEDIFRTKPRLDCVLIFYTGNKGNITQPWQAVGAENGGKVSFLSQERLKNSI